MGALLDGLDRLKVPYLVVLSADHGGAGLVEQLAAEGYPAGRIDGNAILQRMNAAVMAATGLATAPFVGSIEDPALASSVAAVDRPRVLAAAKLALKSEPDVVAAFTLDEVLATKVPRDRAPDELTVEERFARSAYRGRSGDLLVALRPYTASPAAAGKSLAGHGSPWNYDRRVPILFWWNGAPSQTRALPVQTVDIAPTLAAVLGLSAPADIDGNCLPLASLSTCAKGPAQAE